MRRFNSYKQFLINQFGKRVQKLTIDAGFTCPNRDGTVGTGGCTFCSNDAFNPSYCDPSKGVTRQLEEGIQFHRNRYRRADSYLAYFQAYSNTYLPLDQLQKIYEPALNHPDVVGIVIGTRPDCIDEEKLEYFARLNQKRFVSIEYGIESIHNETLEHINRGHTFEQSQHAIEETRKRNIHTGGHFIFGLPFETPEIWMEDLNEINRLGLNSIKFHQLQLIQGTQMAIEFEQYPERFYLFDIHNYIPFIVDFVEKLDPQLIIERFAGEVPPRFLALNNWGTTRYDVILQMIEKEFERRESFQGKFYKI
ncbi:MAG TPA: TIGR01212 family radical SAM protein [Bacteroidales bacterium]|nr:TIGR01212 family radical SAM protein [Bacteroidales bacterium]HOH21716.1 TIGR01212 family radical SAM protein [Bacteroidales bacterium]HPB57419.1 TIGR01212 family radical SAM protein [Bacteroidales bacterium]HPZ02855.1 TIGR01212 family radical SAM protein [Bacteroidales bacterium]HQB74263.1 TIGR01212 family radical SAM protein [Bacteroidales bacterium]